MIGRIDHRAGRDSLDALHVERGARGPEIPLGPVLRAPVVDAAPLHAQEPRNDRGAAVNRRGDDQHYIEEEGADHRK